MDNAPLNPSTLAQVIAPLTQSRPHYSGFHLIARGDKALAWRLGLMEAAERSIDAQYYSIMNDRTGKLLLEGLLSAADRGVRVRLLVDAIALKKSDPTWAILQRHPQVTLKVFNPVTTDRQDWAQRIVHILYHWSRIGRRMHNKVFIVDGQIAITGGRNLGDAYFDTNATFNFRDLDALIIGALVPRLCASFESYWQGKDAHAYHRVRSLRTGRRALKWLRKRLKRHWCRQTESGLLEPWPPIAHQIGAGEVPFVWAEAELAADSPEKLDEPRAIAQSKPGACLRALTERARQELLIISPYFVPGRKGVAWLGELCARGVRVRIFTNSLGSTDVVAVHTGYRKYRKAVLALEAELYEMQPIAGIKERSKRFASASRASLHSKVYVIDRKDVLIGSFNLDPRSIELNTEMAVVAHSTELAEQVAAIFEASVDPENSYRVTMEEGSLRWEGREEERNVVYRDEPKAGLWRRIQAELYSVLMPLEDQL